jgi:hypothetical protein
MPAKSPHTSSSILPQRINSPLRTRKPWDCRIDTINGVSAPDVIGRWGERKDKCWKRERLSELEVSLHGSSSKQLVDQKIKQENTRDEIHVVVVEEAQVAGSSLSPEEKGLIVAGEVMKKRIEEEARKKALDQVKEENERRALQMARREEEADALRMAEEVLRLESVEDLESKRRGWIQQTCARSDVLAKGSSRHLTIGARDEDSRRNQSHFSKSDHLSQSQPSRSKAWGSPLDDSRCNTYDKPGSTWDSQLDVGSDRLFGSQQRRSKASGHPLNGTAVQGLEKPACGDVIKKSSESEGTSVLTNRQMVPTKNRSILSQGSSASFKIFEDDELGKSKHEPTPNIKFKPVSSWASLDNDESSHPLKKPRDKKTRSVVAAKKPTKLKMERFKPQIADDSSIVKVKKANRQKGELTYTKKLRPVASTRKRHPASNEGWTIPSNA